MGAWKVRDDVYGCCGNYDNNEPQALQRTLLLLPAVASRLSLLSLLSSLPVRLPDDHSHYDADADIDELFDRD